MNYGPKLNPRTENKTKKRRGRIKKIIKHGGAVGKRIEIGGRRGASRKWSPLQLFRRAASVYGTRSGTQSKSRQKVAIKSLFPVWRWHFAGNFASDAFSPWPPVTSFFFYLGLIHLSSRTIVSVHFQLWRSDPLYSPRPCRVLFLMY